MTRFNGTGPQGAGPMTGHGRGYCMSFVGPNARFDQGFCRGGVRGRRHPYHAVRLPRWSEWVPFATPDAPVYAPPLSGEQELSFLKEQFEYLEKALAQTKKRIQELENKD